MNRLRTHDFSQFVLTIGGIIIGGYGDDGGVEFEWGAEVGEDTVGADGEVTFSRNNDRRAYCSITVKQTSASHGRLAAMAALQAAQPEILPLPFESFNPRTGERVSSEFCVFKSIPGPSEQKAAQDRVYQVMLPYPKYIGPTTLI